MPPLPQSGASNPTGEGRLRQRNYLAQVSRHLSLGAIFASLGCPVLPSGGNCTGGPARDAGPGYVTLARRGVKIVGCRHVGQDHQPCSAWVGSAAVPGLALLAVNCGRLLAAMLLSGRPVGFRAMLHAAPDGALRAAGRRPNYFASCQYFFTAYQGLSPQASAGCASRSGCRSVGCWLGSTRLCVPLQQCGAATDAFCAFLALFRYSR